jgi:hypothetical protein
MKKFDSKILQILDKYDLQRCTAHVDSMAKFSSVFIKLCKELSSNFNTAVSANCTTYLYETDNQRAAKYIKTSFKSEDISEMYKITIVEFGRLYPTIYYDAFKSDKFSIDISGFSEMYCWLFDNMHKFKHINNKAWRNCRYIINGLYGILWSKKRLLMVNQDLCPINVFMKDFAKLIYDSDNVILQNVDLVMLRGENCSDLLKRISIYFSMINYNVKTFENYRTFCNTANNKSTQAMINRYIG